MKCFITIIIILLSINVVSAQRIEEMNTTIEMKKNGEADANLIFTFADEVKEVYFPLSHDITNLRVEGGKCYVEEGIKNILVCKPSSPFIVGQIIIKINFKIKGAAQTIENKTYFDLDIPITKKTQKINIIVKLPELMALVDNKQLPLSPSNADMGSDGRSITLKWYFESQDAGDIIPLRIYYENINPTNFLQLIDLRWVIFFLVVIAVGVFLIYEKVSQRSFVVLSVLNEAERIIVNILQGEGGKDVDQRKLVISSGFSKAKVTRILQSLEARGVVLLKRTGRKNKVTLKKKFVEEKTEQ